MGCVYLITNTIDGKMYVGLTTRSAAKRWKEHRYNSLVETDDLVLYRAIRKHGANSFEISEIFQSDNAKELIDKEIQMIEKLNTMAPNGYNMMVGGTLPKLSDEARAKISRSRKGKPSPHVGKKQKQETIDKRAASLRGKKLTKQHCDKLSKIRKKPIICIENGVIYDSTKDAAAALGLYASSIFNVLNGKYKQTKGLTFRYIC